MDLSLKTAAIFKQDLRPLAIGAHVVEAIVEEVWPNRQHYSDMARFNLAGGQKFESKKTYDNLRWWDLPQAEWSKVRRLYGLFTTHTTAQIFQWLRIPVTFKNNSSPLEAKYVFEYYRRYGGFGYHPNNKVSDDQILQPLATMQEVALYNSLF
jgi:hypothetical protein